MMTRGRKAKPTHLKLVEGNPGKRAINKNEPKPTGNLVDPPEWLSPSQKEGWKYAIESAPFGLLKRLDSSVLAIWVVAEDLHRQATEKLNSGALLIKTPNGMPTQSPFVSIVNKQAQVMMKAASEMGFTPASRTRIQLEDASQDDENERDFYG
jgi:P27 family predicted phage terminase small subunit